MVAKVAEIASAILGVADVALTVASLGLNKKALKAAAAFTANFVKNAARAVRNSVGNAVGRLRSWSGRGYGSQTARRGGRGPRAPVIPKRAAQPKADDPLVRKDHWYQGGEVVARTDRDGTEVSRILLESQDELLEAAERHAGGNLDSFVVRKEDLDEGVTWYASRDGQVEIEFNMKGHAPQPGDLSGGEGPHVKVLRRDGDGWAVDIKYFQRGWERFKKDWW